MSNGVKLLAALELWGFQHGSLLERYPSQENVEHPVSFSYIFSLKPEIYSR
jgi:hypothetical protein